MAQTMGKNKNSKSAAQTKKSSAKSNGGAKSAKKRGSGSNRRDIQEKTKRRLNPQIKAILLFAVSVILFAFLFIKGANVWAAVRTFLFGVFGFTYILLPILFIYLAVITAKEKQISHLPAKIVLLSAIILFTGSLFYLFSAIDYNDGYNFFEALARLYSDKINAISTGGLISGIFGYPMRFLCGDTAAKIVAILSLIVLVMIITGVTLVDIANVAKKPYDAIKENYRKHQETVREEYEYSYDSDGDVDFDTLEHSKLPRKSKKNTKRFSNGRIDIPLDEKTKNKKQEPQNSEGTQVDFVDEDEGNVEIQISSDVSDEMLGIINRANKGYNADLEKQPAAAIANELEQSKKKANTSEKSQKSEPETVPFDFNLESQKAKARAENKTTVADKAEEFVMELKNEENKVQTAEYKFPPIQLLFPPKDNDNSNAMVEIEENAKKLVDTLKSFGVSASIINICRGPSVTRYELQPAPGVKISKITNLADDIALNLAANGIRIEAPIPGKPAVGIEVPNRNVSIVTMRELIDSDEFKRGKSKLTCVLGRDISGNIVTTDLAKMPHLLIAGTTGSGKSVCVNSILLSILYKATPDEVKLLLIDPKMVEFSKYKGIPHLLVPVVSDAKKAAGALNWAVSEMLQRYKIFSEYDCKNIESYNELIKKNLKYIEDNKDMGEDVCLEVGGLPVDKKFMPQIVIAIDELADLMMAAPNDVEDAICRLAQMARAAGMHLVIATQRPSVNVITGVIKANIPSRIALKVSSSIDSRTILDFGGAEKLIGRGDMLFAPVGAPKPMRVQGCFASDPEIEGVTGFIKKSHDAQYNKEIEEKIRKIAVEELNNKNKNDGESGGDEIKVDSLMDEAIKIVVEAGQASTSLLQRRMKVGYARAGRMIDDMEQMGIVGPHQGSKAREVLITYQQYLERQNLSGNAVASQTPDDGEEE